MIIGITGGIASGKSLVVSVLQAIEGPSRPYIIDADEVYHTLTSPGAPLVTALAAEFGTDVLTPQGAMDRKKLSEKVFSSETARARLNQITHPVIIEEIRIQIKAHRDRHVVLAAPLLIEAGLTSLVDELWLVALSEKTQVERLMNREHIPEEDALRRMASQMPFEEKKRFATRVLWNDGPAEETERAVKALWKQVIKSPPLELVDDHYCFACGTDNPASLKLIFTREGDGLTGTFTASREHQGYRGVVHGGIISTLIDEAMARLLIMKGFSVVTVRMEVRYRKPVPVGEPLIIKAKEEAPRGGKFLKTSALIMSQEGTILSQGEGTFAVI